MADDVDRANERAEAERQAALDAHFKRVQVESMRSFDPGATRHCEDCDCVIPAARVALLPMCSRCTDCAAAWELANGSRKWR